MTIASETIKRSNMRVNAPPNAVSLSSLANNLEQIIKPPKIAIVELPIGIGRRCAATQT
jgi:hypothetical protein